MIHKVHARRKPGIIQCRNMGLSLKEERKRKVDFVKSFFLIQ
jgi:hypothetical protein